MPALERKKKLFLVDARINPDAVISGDFSIKGLLAILDRQIKALRARKIVFDASTRSCSCTTTPRASVRN